MDSSELKEWADHVYNVGWRACIVPHGQESTRLIHRNILNGNIDEIKTDADKECWGYLRAYQDEQRKKGVPIEIQTFDMSKSWHSRDYNHVDEKGNTVNNFFFGTYTPNIQQRFNENFTAYFKNFRWRPGHPKKPNLCPALDCSPVGCGNMVCKTLGEGGSHE